MTTGQTIEKYFDNSKYTYDDLSLATNITYKDLLKLFKEEREISSKELAAFAIIFNTSVENLNHGIIN